MFVEVQRKEKVIINGSNVFGYMDTEDQLFASGPSILKFVGDLAFTTAKTMSAASEISNLMEFIESTKGPDLPVLRITDDHVKQVVAHFVKRDGRLKDGTKFEEKFEAFKTSMKARMLGTDAVEQVGEAIRESVASTATPAEKFNSRFGNGPFRSKVQTKEPVEKRAPAKVVHVPAKVEPIDEVEAAKVSFTPKRASDVKQPVTQIVVPRNPPVKRGRKPKEADESLTKAIEGAQSSLVVQKKAESDARKEDRGSCSGKTQRTSAKPIDIKAEWEDKWYVKVQVKVGWGVKPVDVWTDKESGIIVYVDVNTLHAAIYPAEVASASIFELNQFVIDAKQNDHRRYMIPVERVAAACDYMSAHHKQNKRIVKRANALATNITINALIFNDIKSNPAHILREAVQDMESTIAMLRTVQKPEDHPEDIKRLLLSMSECLSQKAINL